MTAKELIAAVRLDGDLVRQVLADIYQQDLTAELSDSAIQGVLVLEFLALLSIGRSPSVQTAIVRAAKDVIDRKETIRLCDNRYVALPDGAFFDAVDRAPVKTLPPPAIRTMIDVAVIIRRRIKDGDPTGPESL